MLSLLNLLWGGFQDVHIGGFLTAILLLISFLIVFGAAVAATAEGVRQMGRFVPKQTSRRWIYEGSFLGICAAVAIIIVTRSDWLGALEEWSGPIRLVGTMLYFVVALPIRFALFWLPPLVLLIIAAPIGAAIGYNLTPLEETASESENAGEGGC